MTPTADFAHGAPLMIYYTPPAALSAGDVVVVNESVRIAHSDLVAGRQGHLAAGGGVYRVAKATGVGTAIDDGAIVYWDAESSVVTTTAEGNYRFGTTVAEADDDAGRAMVHHIAN